MDYVAFTLAVMVCSDPICCALPGPVDPTIWIIEGMQSAHLLGAKPPIWRLHSVSLPGLPTGFQLLLATLHHLYSTLIIHYVIVYFLHC